ncbi:MAG TPA: alpha/beta family hydrolase [Candidatus Binataceae bacterium]
MIDDSFLVNGPERAQITLVLAHGAGAPMDTPYMNLVAEGVAGSAIRVVRFEFPYMAARRKSGKRSAPDREPALLESWRATIAKLGDAAKLVIGGKSMGGRIASMIADGAGAAGLVCLGYPFHPPGNPSRTRIKHLENLRTPALILQGTRDSFGRPDEVTSYHLSPKIRIQWIEDGDHSLKPRARSGRSEAQNLSEAISHVRNFIADLKIRSR